ncbi:MAG: hypothetical protein H0U27_04180 [Nitrosopumilus sp.]|nr:hypothetical protein [Nitrosopumilus sp.]
MKKFDTRKILLVIISVMGGTVLSAFLFMKTRGNLGPDELKSLAFNMFFAFAIVIGIGLMFARKKN